MKKFIIVAALFLGINVASFAGNNHPFGKNGVSIVNETALSKEITELPSFNLKDLFLEDCTVKFDVTITVGGKVTRLQGEVTVKGKSCLELLKEAAK